MPDTTTTSKPSPPTTDRDAILAYWRQRLRELPDIRMDKVQRTREALERSAYDREQVLNTTIENISNEIGVLCRQAL